MQLWKSPLPLRMVTSSPHYRADMLRRHRHSFYELALVLGGRCTWHMGSRRRASVRAGEALLLEPQTTHAEETAPSEEARIVWLGFDFGGPKPPWCRRPIPLGGDAPEIAGYCDAIASEHHFTDARSQARIGLALQSLLLLVARCAEGPHRLAPPRLSLNSRQTHTVESAAHYFRNNLQNPLSVAQVAAYHSLCPGHFSSLFRQQHRVTPRAYLRQARIERAAELLLGSGMTLKEIAAQCGFVDAAHLCKSFKQVRRVTPSRFRAAMLRHVA